jgi:hypothetical protein
VGSFFVTLFLGFAFGRGILFEIIPETNSVVLNAKIDVKEESISSHVVENDDDLSEVQTPSPEEEVLGVTAELLSPIPTDTPELENDLQLIEIVTPSVTPTLKQTSTLTPTPIATQIPTATAISPTPFPQTPTLTPSPKPTISSLNTFELINQYAGQYGIDAGLLRKIADCESHFNSNAVGAGGLYVGMYQFGSGSWQTMRRQMGLDLNPELRSVGEESIKTAAFAISKGKASMWPNCAK